MSVTVAPEAQAAPSLSPETLITTITIQNQAPSSPSSTEDETKAPLTCTTAKATIIDLKPSPKAVINGIAPHVLDERKSRPQRRGSGSKRYHRRLQYIQYPRFESSPLRVSGSCTVEDLQTQVEFIVDTKEVMKEACPVETPINAGGKGATRSRICCWKLLKIHVNVHVFKSLASKLKHGI